METTAGVESPLCFQESVWPAQKTPTKMASDVSGAGQLLCSPRNKTAPTGISEQTCSGFTHSTRIIPESPSCMANCCSALNLHGQGQYAQDGLQPKQHAVSGIAAVTASWPCSETAYSTCVLHDSNKCWQMLWLLHCKLPAAFGFSLQHVALSVGLCSMHSCTVMLLYSNNLVMPSDFLLLLHCRFP